MVVSMFYIPGANANLKNCSFALRLELTSDVLRQSIGGPYVEILLFPRNQFDGVAHHA